MQKWACKKWDLVQKVVFFGRGGVLWWKLNPIEPFEFSLILADFPAIQPPFFPPPQHHSFLGTERWICEKRWHENEDWWPRGIHNHDALERRDLFLHSRARRPAARRSMPCSEEKFSNKTSHFFGPTHLGCEKMASKDRWLGLLRKGRTSSFGALEFVALWAKGIRPGILRFSQSYQNLRERQYATRCREVLA